MNATVQGRPEVGVFLLDDHEVVRRGVLELFEAEPDITVVGEAGTAQSALARIPALRPDVAVLAEKTVKNYISVLFAKLGMERRTQAAAYAARLFGQAPVSTDSP